MTWNQACKALLAMDCVRRRSWEDNASIGFASNGFSCTLEAFIGGRAHGAYTPSWDDLNAQDWEYLEVSGE